MHRWYLALKNDALLSPAARQKYFAPHIKEYADGSSYYGYGWVSQKTGRGNTLIWHNGGNGITNAFMGFELESYLVVIVSSNIAGKISDSYADRIAQLVSGDYEELGERLLGEYAGTYSLPSGAKIGVRFDENDNLLATYRAKELVGLLAACKHGRVQRQKYFDAGKPCPVVMSFGHHPILFLAACTDVPVKMSEFDYAGGVIGEPIQLVRGPLTGLPIPAYSEIAIEGEMIPGDDLPEGPFGEWPGYYASATRPEPVVRIKALYYRNNPILCGETPLRPSAGQGFHRSIQRSALIWNALDDAGVPDVLGVWLHPAAYRFFSILKIKQRGRCCSSSRRISSGA